MHEQKLYLYTVNVSFIQLLNMVNGDFLIGFWEVALYSFFFVENVFEKVRSRTWNWANCKALSDHILKSTENIKWTSHIPSKLNRIWNVWITIYLILPFKDQQHTQGKPIKALKILVIKRDYFFVVWLLFCVSVSYTYSIKILRIKALISSSFLFVRTHWKQCGNC